MLVQLRAPQPLPVLDGPVVNEDVRELQEQLLEIEGGEVGEQRGGQLDVALFLESTSS